jgi:hypothetical protein
MGWEYIGQHRLEIEVDIHIIAHTSLMSDLQVRTNTNLVMADHFLNRKTKTIYSMSRAYCCKFIMGNSGIFKTMKRHWDILITGYNTIQ